MKVCMIPTIQYYLIHLFCLIVKNYILSILLLLEWLEANNVSRQSDSTLPQVLIREVFRMPHPEEGDSVYRAVTLPQGVAVVALDSVNEGQADEQMNAFVSQMAEQLRAQAIIQGLIDDLRSDARIER